MNFMQEKPWISSLKTKIKLMWLWIRQADQKVCMYIYLSHQCCNKNQNVGSKPKQMRKYFHMSIRYLL